MNLLAVHLVEGGHTDDRGGDGAEDEATRHDGEEGVLEGGGDGSLGDEGVGERGGGANGHGGGELLDLGAVRGGRGERREGEKAASEKYSARGKRPANWQGGVEDRGAVIDERFLADRSRGGASTDGGREIDPSDLPRAFCDVSGDAPERSRPRFARPVNRPSSTHLSANSTDHQSGGGPSKRRWRDSHLATAFTDTAFTAWTRLTVVSRTGGTGRSVG